MTLFKRALAVLGFRVLPTSIITGIIYLVVFIATLVFQELPLTPSKTSVGRADVALDAAWADIQVIATFPHPFNSHQNEVVQKHILTRIESFAASDPNVEVVFDNTTSATYTFTYGTPFALHYEATNILVRINGTNTDLDAVLVSAHYDSVSTAPGATDAGMGVVTAMALVEYFAKHRPLRTIIFNINNGEEDGLLGARIFMEHPWSKLPKVFLNLEGAGAGGRPILFRSSSTALTRAFKGAARPHGSSLTSDVFSSGVLKSNTDFTIYSDAGLHGLDLAFYERRALYHTKDDSVPSLQGKSALWAMLQASLVTTVNLANNPGENVSGGRPVYVDFLGRYMLVATQGFFFGLNLALLIIGPIIVFALTITYSRNGELERLTAGWRRYPIAFLVNAFSTFGLAAVIAKINPNIAYASSYAVLFSLIGISYLSLYFSLSFAQLWKPVHQPKSAGLLTIYWLSWFLLVSSEVLLNGPQMGGLFFATFLNISSLFAVVLDLLQSLYVPRSTEIIRTHAIEHQEGDEEATEVERTTEITPLLGDGRNGVSAEKETGEDNQPILWIVQLLLLLPVQSILMMQGALLILFALGQTVVDGSAPGPIYMGVALCAVLLFLPLAPFVHKLHINAAIAIFVLLLISVPYSLLTPPFSDYAPFKAFFQQSVDLDTGIQLVHIHALPGYATRDIISTLPSAHDQNITCGVSDARGAYVEECTFPGITPRVAPGLPKDWLALNVSRVSTGSARLVLHGTNTRSCRLYFDRTISSFHLEGETQTLTSPVKAARLWSRDWNPTFSAIVKWTGGGTLKGRAACEWAEQVQGRIPALDEALAFSPSWVRLTKANDGLVEVLKSFEV